MKKKHSYSAEPLSKVELTAGLLESVALGCLISIDVAREKFVFALATLAGEVVRLVRFEHPRETVEFLRLVSALKAALGTDRPVVAVMEPTGTYGDAIRFQLTRAGVAVHVIAAKATHDSRELFDGVPSMHDGKAAVQLARLFPILSPEVWRDKSEEQRELRALVDERQFELGSMARAYGALEALLARHWPELDTILDVHHAKMPLVLLASYPGPRAVGGADVEVRQLMKKRGRLASETIERVVTSARTTLGIPMLASEETLLRARAAQLLERWDRIDAIDALIERKLEQDPHLTLLRRAVGAYTTGVLVSYSDPRSFRSAKSFEKACGLNLKVQSSGEKAGRLSLTKRGPAVVRQILYLATLRLVAADPIARAWYVGRRSWAEHKQKALAATMRKLARALWHVARGEPFDAHKLFDVRRLDVVVAADEDPPKRSHGWIARAQSAASGRRRTRQASLTPIPST
jgi:transposase